MLRSFGSPAAKQSASFGLQQSRMEAGSSWLRSKRLGAVQRAYFGAISSIYQESTVVSENPSSHTVADPALHATVTPTSIRQTRRIREGGSASRKTSARESLAKIEATRGVVSPFLRDNFAREHDYLRIRYALMFDQLCRRDKLMCFGQSHRKMQSTMWVQRAS